MIDIKIGNLIKWSQEYDKMYSGTKNERTEIRLKKLLETQRYLEKPDFIDLCMWKSQRPKRHYESNDNKLIKEITKYCFSTNNEEARITKLIELRGVSWPVASVILHFAFPDNYPILDFRAIWSLGWEKPRPYTFDFWRKYCNEISRIAKELNLPTRMVDKALWAYSKENQKKSTTYEKIIIKSQESIIVDRYNAIDLDTPKGLFKNVFGRCDEYLQNLFSKVAKNISDSFSVEHYPTDKPDYRFRKKNIFCELVLKPRKGCIQVLLRVDSFSINSQTLSLKEMPASKMKGTKWIYLEMNDEEQLNETLNLVKKVYEFSD